MFIPNSFYVYFCHKTSFSINLNIMFVIQVILFIYANHHFNGNCKNNKIHERFRKK